MVPLSNRHSKITLFPETGSGPIILSCPTHSSKLSLLITVFVSLSMISIGSNKEEINGGNPCVENVPATNRIAFFVKTMSAASAVGFSIISMKGASAPASS